MPEILFLPQRPYLPIASLARRGQLPSGRGERSTMRAFESVLCDTGLASFGTRLDDVQNWSLLLSGGEQQRLAIARAVLQGPEWLFLDEATAALDEAAESELYTLLRERLPNAAIVSIAHRPRVGDFHDMRVLLGPKAGATSDTVEVAASVLDRIGRPGASTC